MTKQCNNVMEQVEAKIGNAKQPLFDDTEPDRVYYSAFGDTGGADKLFYLIGKIYNTRDRLKLTRLTLKY